MECRQQLAGLLDNDSFGSLCIGPAGEELIPSATVISDDRAAGRAGLGAVLGWKNLKAITVTGSKPIPIYNKEKTIVENKKWFAALSTHPFTSDKEKVSSCVGCPIRCKTPGTEANAILNDLGIDSIAAAKGIQWLEERIGFKPEANSKNKDGQRRKGIYPAMLKAFGLMKKSIHTIPGTVAFVMNQRMSELKLDSSLSVAKQSVITVLKDPSIKDRKLADKYIMEVNRMTNLGHLYSTVGTYLCGMGVGRYD